MGTDTQIRPLALADRHNKNQQPDNRGGMMPPSNETLEGRIRKLELDQASQLPLLRSIENKINDLAVLDKRVVAMVEREASNEKTDAAVWKRIDDQAGVLHTISTSIASFTGAVTMAKWVFLVLAPLFTAILGVIGWFVAIMYNDVQNLKTNGAHHQTQIEELYGKVHEIEGKRVISSSGVNPQGE